MVFKKKSLVFVVFAIFFLALFTSQSNFSIAQEEGRHGCYLYPSDNNNDIFCESGISESVVEEDCDQHSDCDIDVYFEPYDDCSLHDVCRLVECTATCQIEKLGYCEDFLDGEEITSDEENNYWCNPGCCYIIGNPQPGNDYEICQMTDNRYECEQLSIIRNTFVNAFDSSLGMNSETCSENYCNLGTPGTGTIIVKVIDQDTTLPISGAITILEGKEQQCTSNTQGICTFTGINPGNNLVRASASGYYSASKVIDLLAEQTADVEINLRSATDIGDIEGIVKDSSGNELTGATVSWRGPTSSNTETRSDGTFSVTGLPLGTYTFTASKIGYVAEVQEVEIGNTNENLDFSLGTAELYNIKGKVILDRAGIQEDAPFARVYVNDSFKGYADSEGNYDVKNIHFPSGVDKAKFKLHALYQSFRLQPPEIVVIESGDYLTEGKNLILTVYVGECNSIENIKAVEELYAAPVPGEKAVKLTWIKPCPEVTGYSIQRFKGGEIDGQTFHASAVEESFVDQSESLQWNQEYTYKVTASFSSGEMGAESNAVNVGNKLCEGHYLSTELGWESFCILGTEEERKIIWTCDNNNQLLAFSGCDSGVPGESYFCSEGGDAGAQCKDAGECLLGANPFGMYSSANSCYKDSENPTTYCYYDYSFSSVDSCQSCENINSCFEYKSAEACTVNNCLGTGCGWLDAAANVNPIINYENVLPGWSSLITPETGTGYCVQVDYDQDDNCSLCSAGASLFENDLCTAEICSGLGRCFSEGELKECSSCGDDPSNEANCYTYNTELECVSDQEVSKSAAGVKESSLDRCGWGTCYWESTNDFNPTGCFKDGNFDQLDDCQSFVGNELQSCRIDNNAPRTTILPEGINTISYGNPKIIFDGDDSYHTERLQRSALEKVYFCLTPLGVNEQSNCYTTENFETLNYPGRVNHESLEFNLINNTVFEDQKIDGEIYKLVYHSEDRYHNLEDLQETFLFIDNVLPEYNIDVEQDTSGDKTTLTVRLLEESEPMGCEIKLTQLIPPLASPQLKTLGRDEIKIAVFENLPGVKYNLSVSCTDQQNNINTKFEELVFNIYPGIEIIYPAFGDVLSTQEIAFEIRTEAAASCQLYDTITNELIADFKIIDDDIGKHHKTEPITGFYQRAYAAEHKVVCQELLAVQGQAEQFQNYFNFFIDFDAPKTKIILREGEREKKPTRNYWKESFVENVEITFDCSEDKGFECVETYYCLGEVGGECSDYTAYGSTSFTLQDSARICYYSEDSTGNPEIPYCGDILIEGYGVTLENPSQYYFAGEQWGISNENNFTLKFFTKIPTTECKFDFRSITDYDALPDYKTIPKLQTGGEVTTYEIETFPEDVFENYNSNGEVLTLFIKCKNGDDIIGPEEKINLEYDPSSPVIEDAYADPENVVEESMTTLYIDTDDKTQCKFDEESEEYDTMRYSFPGIDEHILYTSHNIDFGNFRDLDENGQKDYSLNVVCKNGAEDVSEVETIEFSVDYSARGFIYASSLFPQGRISETDITLSAQTNKGAICQYKNANNTDTEDYSLMESGDSRLHSIALGTLPEGEYRYIIECTFGSVYLKDQTEINFIIDQTAPVITEIDDGKYTCGSDEIKVLTYTEEDDTSAYYYELYDMGKVNTDSLTGTSSTSNNYGRNRSSSSSSSYSASTSGGILVKNGTVQQSDSFQVSADGLNESHRYVFKVMAGDEINNWGEFKTSDGIVVVNRNATVCDDEDAPIVTFTVDDQSSCFLTYVELHVDDDVGVNAFNYGQQNTLSLCSANTAYDGDKLSFNQSGYVCYQVKDYVDNNATGSKKIVFQDDDGDGVKDRCDICPDTSAGEIVDNDGCSDDDSDSDERNDNDGDGLPDYWEKLYTQIDCELNYLSKDSNDNSIFDRDEDYDDDGYNNYDEYLSHTDPCTADEPAEPTEGCTVDMDCDTGFECLNQRCVPKYVPSESKGGNTLAWILFILGLLMIIGGTGYLIYYYKYSPQSKLTTKNNLQKKPLTETKISPSVKKQPTGLQLGDGLKSLKKKRQDKLKKRERQSVFGTFNKESEKIPHLDRILQKKITPVKKVAEIAKKYTENKKNIQPGLKHGEKGIFSQLEGIAKKADGKDIKKVLNKGKANDVFAKLKNISKKRKNNK